LFVVRFDAESLDPCPQLTGSQVRSVFEDPISDVPVLDRPPNQNWI
jgi:hypothetical protein